ncbi:MAG: DHH family phosphoesterase, partial [Oscillospiraceae bacterium]|nr:DHH family phosphoesterase [Oscillospiraceae bacterium]
MTRKRWKISKANKAQAGALAAAAELPPVATLLALNRGVEDGEELLQFLGLEGGAQTNPYDLPDMELAVERVERALEKGEHITVFGDYDCDGVCATALLYQYLSTRTKALSHYLPDRQKEGYGLNMAAVDVLHERGTKLIITVDNGVSAIREIEHARALG